MQRQENTNQPAEKKRKPIPILRDILYCTALAGRALIRDEFSLCFQQKESKTEVTFLYGLSILSRYGLLFPVRLLLTLSILLFYTVLIILSQLLLRGFGRNALVMYACKGLLWAIGVRMTHHGEKYPPNTSHVFVSNHTTYLDYLVLSSYKYSHSVIAQRQGGFMSLLLKLVSGSIQFERNQKSDREEVKKEIAGLTRNSSIIVFPEGTCVNNEYTVMFQKGAFELDVLVYPAAIKYNKKMGDPYWNTRKQSFSKHFIYLITRWRTEVTVWWLPPMKRETDENPSEFALRVKKRISERAGLKNLVWNGYLKHCTSPEEMKEIRMWRDQVTSTLETPLERQKDRRK